MVKSVLLGSDDPSPLPAATLEMASVAAGSGMWSVLTGGDSTYAANQAHPPQNSREPYWPLAPTKVVPKTVPTSEHLLHQIEVIALT